MSSHRLCLWICLFLRVEHPTSVLLPGKSHGQKSLVGCSPWGHEELDTTKQFHFHFSLSCVGEGNGNPLQCSCLENPRGRRAWWADVYGVAQSQSRLKWFSSSSSKRRAQLKQLVKGLQKVSGDSAVKNMPEVHNTQIWVWSLGLEDPLKEDMATHSSILAGNTPWTKDSGRLQSMRSQRVRQNWGDWECVHARSL